MNPAVLLDSGPLSLLTHRKSLPLVQACRRWLVRLETAGWRVLVPEITDYELRRELIRARKARSLAELDALGSPSRSLPLTTAAMRKAAELWAIARQTGHPTATDEALDADVILAAQALTLGGPVIVATTNIGHLSRFVPADLWQNISP